jgi:hypothetical protein
MLRWTWTKGDFTLAQVQVGGGDGKGGGMQYFWNSCRSTFSLPNKFSILLPGDLIVENNFKKKIVYF